MSYGVFTPTIPDANDVILGEYKVYANYGTPTELLIGSTQGGCKVSIDKSIKPVKCDGQYSEYYLDSNGVPLVRVDQMNASIALQQLYLKYIHDKVISNCESTDTGWASSSWDGTGGTYAAETSIKNRGLQSAKMTADTSGYGIHNVFSASKDLTVFANGETSAVGDYIGFAVYISTQDLTDLSTADLRVCVHKDAYLTDTNYYYYDVEASALTANQWTTFKVAKSSFTQEGSASWSAVTGISVKLSSAPGAEVVAYFDDFRLIHNQTNSIVLPTGGGNFEYVDHSTYRDWTMDLEIEDEDYYENITLVGQKFDGKMFKIILSNCYCDSNLSLAFQEKKEIVDGVTFSAHYDRTLGTTFPLKMREYTS
jgi:hypothetical protein